MDPKKPNNQNVPKMQKQILESTKGEKTKMKTTPITDNLILQTIATEPQYAYQLRKTIKQQTGIQTHEATINNALIRLEQAGHLQAKLDEANTQGSLPRKIYTITTRGQRKLTALKVEAKLQNSQIKVSV